MLKVGITGQSGFVGTHLYNTLGLYPKQYKRIEFRKEFFNSEIAMDNFVTRCDVIVHLAAMNRNEDQQVIYQTNIALVKKLLRSLKRTKSRAHILFSSSSQEESDTPYGKSKKEGRELLARWAIKSGGGFTGAVVPNVFGPFGLPNYNSFIATFCYRLTHQEQPEVKVNNTVKLIYISELINIFLEKIKERKTQTFYSVPYTTEIKVSEVLSKLEQYKSMYFQNGEIPPLKTTFDLNLFNTFRSYIGHDKYFPVKFTQHKDQRGSFVEVIRLNIGGQVSFSTTAPGITRGNHFHTRKIERFTVIKGNALIQLRRIGTSEVLSFELDGDEPSYVDIPVWYTHNIKNIGKEVVYTIFWINESYDPDDTDTYFEEVIL